VSAKRGTEIRSIGGSSAKIKNRTDRSSAPLWVNSSLK